MVYFSPDNKGEQICITGGKYLGLHGWCWLGKDDTPKCTYVVLTLNDG